MTRRCHRASLRYQPLGPVLGWSLVATVLWMLACSTHGPTPGLGNDAGPDGPTLGPGNDAGGQSSADGPTLTNGRYMGQAWHIDRNHILYWDGKPYIPSFTNDFTVGTIGQPDPEVTVEMIKKDIDAAVQKGMTQFLLDVVYFPDTPSHAEQSDEQIKQVTEYIDAVGGTYYLGYSLHLSIMKLLAKQHPDKYQKCLTDYAMSDEGCTENQVLDMLKPERLVALREDLGRLGRVAATPALRAIELVGEINAGEIDGTDKELMENLEAAFNVYGKMAKEEVGDVPVVFRGSSEGMRPYLTGLRAENFDGIRMQFSGPTPTFVHTLAQRNSIILRVLNSCPQTKVYWAYSEGRLGGSFHKYRSKELMRGAYQAMIAAGVTGFPYDQSPWGDLSTIGLPEDPPELREQNHQWWVELQPEFEAEILRRAKSNEFSTGKWAVPIRDEEWHPAATLDEDKVESILKSLPNVQPLLKLGAKLTEFQFLRDYSAWMGLFTGKRGLGGVVWEMWIDDSADGAVLMDGIKAVEDMRKAGYPIPPEDVLVSMGYGFDCGSYGECEREPGCACPSADLCSGEAYFDGCCFQAGCL